MPEQKTDDAPLEPSGVCWVHYSELVPWDRNPNTHPEAQPGQIAESIRAFGFVAPCVVWPGENLLVAGHGRLMAMRLICETGYDYFDDSGEMQRRLADPGFVPHGAPGPGMIRVLFHEFEDAAKAKLYAVADNELARSAEMDSDAVRELLTALKADDALEGVHAIGFDFATLSDFIEGTPQTPAAPAQEPATTSTDPSPAPAPPTQDKGGKKPEDRIVNWTVPMSPEERAVCISVTNAAKRIGGVETTREALLLIVRDYEAQHGLGKA